MGTRNDKTTAGVRVGRGSQGCFNTISRDSLRSHGPERGAVVRRGFLSRHASGQRDLNRPEGLRSRETALKEIASETAPTAHHIEDSPTTTAPLLLSRSAPLPLNRSAPLLLRPSAPLPLHPSAPLPFNPSASFPWLFSARTDLSVFLGSAVVSLLALWIGARAGVLYSETPDWAWVPAVLLIDVAHVWSTSFRVYLDTDELKRRPWLYSLVPVLGLAIGIALYSEGELVFWRALAYLAVFHFIRQPYGWVALYRVTAGGRDALG